MQKLRVKSLKNNIIRFQYSLYASFFIVDPVVREIKFYYSTQPAICFYLFFFRIHWSLILQPFFTQNCKQTIVECCSSQENLKFCISGPILLNKDLPNFLKNAKKQKMKVQHFQFDNRSRVHAKIFVLYKPNLEVLNVQQFFNKLIRMSSSKISNSRLGWTIKEQEYLKKLYQEEGMRSWKLISKQINSLFLNIKRTPKQCRQRYTNYIKYSSNESEEDIWTQENDVQLFQKYMELGSKWVEICKTINKKSENFLKNRFYGSIRKVQRRINRVEKLNKMKKHKPIKFDSLLKILQSSGASSNQVYINPQLKVSYQDFIQKLKQNILQMAIASQQSTSNQQILQLISRIHKFNADIRFFNITKHRENKTFKRRALPPFIRIKKKQSSSMNQSYVKQDQIKQNVPTPDAFNQVPEQFRQIFYIQISQSKNNKNLEQQFNYILKSDILNQQDYKNSII